MRTGIKILDGHVSQATAYLQTDYPYSRQLRCHRKTWVETKTGHGQRFVYQTSDPRAEVRRQLPAGSVWHNAPKASTYSDCVIMYLITEGEEAGHVTHETLRLGCDEETQKKFLEDFGEEAVLDDPHRRKVIEANRKYYLRRQAKTANFDGAESFASSEREGGPRDPEVGGGAE